MFGLTTFIYYRLKSIIQRWNIANINKNKSFGQNALTYSNRLSRYAGHIFLNAKEANIQIKHSIESGIPFMVARYGATELLNMRTFDFKYELQSKKKARFYQLCQWSGFFPEDINLGKEFLVRFREASTQVDFFAVWYNAFEDYYVKKFFSSEMKCFYLNSIEPWTSKSIPWSSALKNKKVLVIHPFTESIQKQYEKRELIFPGTNILPEFELKTLKAVQTIAGEKDERFETWFDALNWMYQEAMKIDFDIAIIGCGAYGFPLAAMLKKAGKQAIHLGGVTQILFGIKGKRWDEQEEYQYIRDFYNDAWVYPSETDKPKHSNEVEGGCYW